VIGTGLGAGGHADGATAASCSSAPSTRPSTKTTSSRATTPAVDQSAPRSRQRGPLTLRQPTGRFRFRRCRPCSPRGGVSGRSSASTSHHQRATYRCPSRVTTSIANPMTTPAGTSHQVCSAVTSAAHQAASCSRALPALRPACPAQAGSGSSPRPLHHGTQLGDLAHAERDHPALVGSVRPHPDEQTRRTVIAGVLPHRDVARDPLVTDWLARLALPVRAVIIQLWSLAVLDQLRLVRSRRLVFAGHDGVHAMCAPAQQSCEADRSPRRSVCRVTPTAHTTNDQQCRGRR